MNLETVIQYLSSKPSAQRVPIGLGEPHSWRGDYAQLAFEPEYNVTFGEMLRNASSVLGKEFDGYKGGQFKMTGETQCWLSPRGRSWQFQLSVENMSWLFGYRTTPITKVLCERVEKTVLETLGEQQILPAAWVEDPFPEF